MISPAAVSVTVAALTLPFTTIEPVELSCKTPVIVDALSDTLPVLAIYAFRTLEMMVDAETFNGMPAFPTSTGVDGEF